MLEWLLIFLLSKWVSYSVKGEFFLGGYHTKTYSSSIKELFLASVAETYGIGVGDVKIVDGVDKILPYEDEVQIWYLNLREANIDRAYL